MLRGVLAAATIIALSGPVACGAAGLPPGDAARGQAVAVGTVDPAAACQSCHGIDGAGEATAGFPRLSGLTREVIVKALTDYAGGRRPNPVMTPIAKALSETEIVDVATYYATTRGEMVPVPTDVPPEALQRAGILNAIGDAALGIQACQNCHGPSGRGMGVTYPPLAGQSAIYLEQQLVAWREGRRTGDPADVMRAIARALEPEDLKPLAAYFAAIDPLLDETAAEETGASR